MAKRLTQKGIENLGSKRAAYIVWDSGAIGLGLKVTPRGSKIWLAQLKYPGHRMQTRRTLGRFPGLGLVAAREQAARWYGLVKQGIDPGDADAEEQEKREAARRAEALKRTNTFAAYAERYIAGRTNRRANADAAEIRRMLVPSWAERPIHKIRPADVRALIDQLKRKAPYDARNAWTHAVQIFKLAVHEELIEVSPCASLDRRLLFAGVKIEPRQRVLNDTEVFALWRAANALGYPAQQFYQLLLLTGVRLSELLEAEWSEFHPEVRRQIREASRTGLPVNWAAVDNAVKLWTIPRGRFKSDSEHIVPLTDSSLAILEGLPRFPGCDFLFTLNAQGPVWLGDRVKRQLDARMLQTLRALARMRGDDPAAVKLAGWVTHDLRRVVRTNLAALDVADPVAEMALGHGRKGLQRVYDQHKYLEQIRVALERWAERLRNIVSPAPATTPIDANVVALASKRRARR